MPSHHIFSSVYYVASPYQDGYVTNSSFGGSFFIEPVETCQHEVINSSLILLIFNIAIIKSRLFIFEFLRWVIF